jgi:hypothetical protein
VKSIFRQRTLFEWGREGRIDTSQEVIKKAGIRETGGQGADK